MLMLLWCQEFPLCCSSIYEHIPLKKVSEEITNISKLSSFLIDFYNSIDLQEGERVALLGLNPHAGDDGVLGDEEKSILKARDLAISYR